MYSCVALWSPSIAHIGLNEAWIGPPYQMNFIPPSSPPIFVCLIHIDASVANKKFLFIQDDSDQNDFERKSVDE